MNLVKQDQQQVTTGLDTPGAIVQYQTKAELATRDTSRRSSSATLAVYQRHKESRHDPTAICLFAAALTAVVASTGLCIWQLGRLASTASTSLSAPAPLVDPRPTPVPPEDSWGAVEWALLGACLFGMWCIVRVRTYSPPEPNPQELTSGGGTPQIIQQVIIK